jgi:CheY-like chemotaxis protein
MQQAQQASAGAADILKAVADLAWPLLVTVLVWRLYPAIKRVLEARGFTLKVGGMEVTVQEVSDKLRLDVEDLQRKVSDLRAALDTQATALPAGGPAAPERQAVPTAPAPERPRPRRILWVDDQPSNNAFEIERLRQEGVDVVTVTSTSDAMRRIVAAPDAFALVISDMGRREDGAYRAKAGLMLIRAIREAGIDRKMLPVIVYSSAKYAERNRADVIAADGNGVTASPVELFEMIHSIIPLSNREHG